MIQAIKKKLLSGEKASVSITRSAVVILSMGLVSKLLGLLRDRILASRFGAGDILDVYHASFKFPDLIYNLLIIGSVSAAFVPIFTSLISKKKEEDAWKLTNSLISIGSLVVIFVSILMIIGAPFLVKLLVPGYDEEKRQLVVELTRVMLFSPIILGISGVFGGILNSFRKFFFYSLSPLFYNIGIIIGAVFFVELWGPVGLAVGVILGAIFHLLVQVPEVRRCGLKFKFDFDLKNENLRKVFSLMIPRTMGVASTQINLLVITFLASFLPAGSLAIFSFANNLQSVVLGLFGISFAVAAFPFLSCAWAKENKTEFKDKFSRTFRKIIFFVIPFSVLIFLLRAQIVRVVLGTGEFDWDDTVMTFRALGIFAVSLWAQSLIPLLARSFYAIQNTKTPFFIGIFSELLNIGLAVALLKPFGILGIVWAFSVAAMANALLLLFFLTKNIGKLEKGLAVFTAKILIATFLAALVTQLTKNLIGADPFGETKTFLGILTQLIIGFSVGLSTFLVFGKILKLEELDHFIFMVKNKLFLRKEKTIICEESREEMENIGK